MPPKTRALVKVTKPLAVKTKGVVKASTTSVSTTTTKTRAGAKKAVESVADNQGNIRMPMRPTLDHEHYLDETMPSWKDLPLTSHLKIQKAVRTYLNEAGFKDSFSYSTGKKGQTAYVIPYDAVEGFDNWFYEYLTKEFPKAQITKFL
ncbi:hypothetical protein HDU79_011763 [Rhizoclosmatium sp. JEL0117]|nr:hypothetical protein HDU79_011763 [Rhizoclosmatium sp. JEL0117]